MDAGQAGEGSLEIGISCNGQYIPNQVKLLVAYIKREPEDIIIHITQFDSVKF